jgi:hypothetical protein
MSESRCVYRENWRGHNPYVFILRACNAKWLYIIKKHCQTSPTNIVQHRQQNLVNNRQQLQRLQLLNRAIGLDFGFRKTTIARPSASTHTCTCASTTSSASASSSTSTRTSTSIGSSASTRTRTSASTSTSTNNSTRDGTSTSASNCRSPSSSNSASTSSSASASASGLAPEVVLVYVLVLALGLVLVIVLLLVLVLELALILVLVSGSCLRFHAVAFCLASGGSASSVAITRLPAARCRLVRCLRAVRLVVGTSPFPFPPLPRDQEVSGTSM